MIITKQKELKEILKFLEGEKKIFLIGCGECSTTCKTGGEDDIRRIREFLELGRAEYLRVKKLVQSQIVSELEKTHGLKYDIYNIGRNAGSV